jgi:hypothetical protein
MYSGKISGILLEIKVASSVAVQVLFFQLKCYVLVQSISSCVYIYSKYQLNKYNLNLNSRIN